MELRSTIRQITLALTAGIATVLVSSPLHAREFARDLDLSAPMVPYVYRYAACIFDNQKGTVEERVKACAATKETVAEDAMPVLGKWHRFNTPTRERQFTRALDLLEDEAVVLAGRGEVPASILGYMQCVSDSLTGQRAFMNGRVLDAVDIDPACREGNFASFAEMIPLERRLYERVRIQNRVIRPVLSDLPAIEYRDGLLAARYF